MQPFLRSWDALEEGSCSLRRAKQPLSTAGTAAKAWGSRHPRHPRRQPTTAAGVGARGARWGMSTAQRTSPPLQRCWRRWRWRRRWRTMEAAAAAAAAVAASAVTAAAAAAAATPRLVGSGLRAVAGGRAVRGGGGQDDTCTREGGVGIRQREGAQARPLGADGMEVRRAGRSPGVHWQRRRRHIRSWRRERIPGASPPLGDYPRPRRPRAGGGPKPGGVSESIMRK